MSEIKLTGQDKFLSTFLDFLKTLNYVEIEEINEAKNLVEDRYVKYMATGDPLLQALRPVRQSVTLEQIAKEQNYTKTDWVRLEMLADELDIQEPSEEALTQLMP